jgi:hypothetical protein
MLYQNNNGVFIYYLNLHANAYQTVDTYNFVTMERNPDALRLLLTDLINRQNLTSVQPDFAALYTIKLDFIANARTPLITAVIERLVDYLNTNSIVSMVTENPLCVTFHLPIRGLLMLLRDPNFQSINQDIAALSSSTWFLKQ